MAISNRPAVLQAIMIRLSLNTATSASMLKCHEEL